MPFRYFNSVVCIIVLFAFFLLLSGCGGVSDAPETATVKGTVTFDGKPLPEGSIVFDPADGNGGSSAGGIKDGKFEFQSQFGPKRVLISASRETGKKGEYGESISESYIPKKYNNKSELKADVTKTGKNSFHFELKSK